MNVLEKQARPILEPIANKQEVSIGVQEAEILSRWIAVKCIVAEHWMDQNWVTPKTDRGALKDYGTIPSYFTIYAATFPTDVPPGLSRSTSALAAAEHFLADQSPDSPKNVASMSFSIGRTFFHLNASRVLGFHLEHEMPVDDLYETHRLWPNNNVDKLPNLPYLNPEQALGMRFGLRRYMNSMAQRLGLPQL